MVTKKVRFEVFKRDGFRCAYCGRTPPQVILEIDHIDPRAEGGNDDTSNLLTSCFDCNRGKRDKPLTKAPTQLVENLEILKEKEAQLLAYRMFVEKVNKRVQKDIEEIAQIYVDYYPYCAFPSRFKQGGLRKFLTLLPKHEIIEALYLALGKIPDSLGAIRYFCGICWNKIRENEQRRRDS